MEIIAKAAQETLTIAENSFPTLPARNFADGGPLTQFQSISLAKHLLGTIPALLGRGEEKRALVVIGQAQGLLRTVGVEGAKLFDRINDSLAA